MTEIKNCLPRPPSEGKCTKVSFPNISERRELVFNPDHVNYNPVDHAAAMQRCRINNRAAFDKFPLMERF